MAIAALTLAACGQSAPEKAEPAPAAPEPEFVWTPLSSDEGAALALQDEAGAMVLNIACLRTPARMRVTVPAFSEIGSEERLSFGADGEPFVFVAQLGDDQLGVAGEREVQLDLVTRLLNAEAVTASYGTQVAGPYAAPPRDQAETFAAACREMAG
jgi:hypothetical protein